MTECLRARLRLAESGVHCAAAGVGLARGQLALPWPAAPQPDSPPVLIPCFMAIPPNSSLLLLCSLPCLPSAASPVALLPALTCAPSNAGACPPWPLACPSTGNRAPCVAAVSSALPSSFHLRPTNCRCTLHTHLYADCAVLTPRLCVLACKDTDAPCNLSSIQLPGLDVQW